MERPSKKKTAANSKGSSKVGRQAQNGDEPSHLETSNPKVSEEEGQQKEDTFYQLFGFSKSDLKSWDSVVRLMSRPADPAGLAYIRFIFGLLMMVDVFEERGLSKGDVLWGDEKTCRFPLFDFMQPLSLPLMILLYLIMLLGAGGIALGANYRVSCLMHLLPYWYIVLLEKSRWNNHSYLFGLLSFLLLLCDANRYWSLDGLVNSKIRNADVPLWNYTLLRAQVFLVYFLAGLKKLDVDWVNGYSMGYLSEHWVFYPFKFVLTESQVSLLVVHLGGLTIDLFVGFLLFFDKTRLMGVLMSTAFHLMNAQMFAIGMFPYAMLGLTPVFFYATWPRAIFCRIPRSLRILTPDDGEDDVQPSRNCLYSKEQAKPELTTSPESKNSKDRVIKELTPPTRASFRHHAAAIFTILFILWQMFLPYSHFITKGYNSWTQGLYGYSWDMMIHARDTQHTRISFVNKDTGEQGYLDPHAWTSSHRWTGNADMVKQYANCIADRLQPYGIYNMEIYFDIWISMNKRFQQRVVNPYVDIMTAEWSVFKPTPWMLPLLVDLSDWRAKLDEIQNKMFNSTDLYEVVFLADFPGMHLENYVHPGVTKLNISVLKGQVVVEVLPEEGSLEQSYNITLYQDQEAQIPSGMFHNVYTVSSEPSCYMYVYSHTEDLIFLENLKELELSLNGSLDNPIPDKFVNDPKLNQYIEALKAKNSSSENQTEETFKSLLYSSVYNHYMSINRGLKLIKGALWTIYTGKPFEVYLKEMNKQLAREMGHNNTGDMKTTGASTTAKVPNSLQSAGTTSRRAKTPQSSDTTPQGVKRP